MRQTQPNLSEIRDESLLRSKSPKPAVRLGQIVVRRNGVLEESSFQALLTLERRRAERSRKPFVLMLLRTIDANGSSKPFLSRLVEPLSRSIRETDLIGWYAEGQILGVLFTEINCASRSLVTEVLQAKVMAVMQKELDWHFLSNLGTTIHFFPEDKDENNSDPFADTKLYPDLSEKGVTKRLPHILKRAIDILGSGSFLLLCSPIYALVSLVIKLTSRGPVIFKQERLGQFGRRFECLKFRTMYVNNSPKVHEEYIAKFIAGQTEPSSKGSEKIPVYKITNDSRVTLIGKVLRKTSLDELPQFWNVLRGEMSLVGPRPPVPYEFRIYDIWHRRRVLEVKPGITGLWQVSGRSRTSFDDMVRLDLRYCQSWSLWLDLKILLATPRAVLTGEGAY